MASASSSLSTYVQPEAWEIVRQAAEKHQKSQEKQAAEQRMKTQEQKVRAPSYSESFDFPPKSNKTLGRGNQDKVSRIFEYILTKCDNPLPSNSLDSYKIIYKHF